MTTRGGFGLAVQRADAEQRGQRADVVGVAVRQQDRVDAAGRPRRNSCVEHDAELGHRQRRVHAADGDAADV